LMLLTVCSGAAAWPTDDGDADEINSVDPEVNPATLVNVGSDVPAYRMVPEGLKLTRRAAARFDWRDIPNHELKCFTGPEWAEVGGLVVDYRWLWGYAQDLEMMVALLQRQVALQQQQIIVLEGMVASADSGRRTLGDALASAAAVGERDRKAARFERGLLVGAVVIEAIIIAAESGVLLAQAAMP